MPDNNKPEMTEFVSTQSSTSRNVFQNQIQRLETVNIDNQQEEGVKELKSSSVNQHQRPSKRQRTSSSTSSNQHFLPLKRPRKSMEGGVTISVCITCYSVFMLVGMLLWIT